MFVVLLRLVILPAAFAALPTYIICRYRVYRRTLVTYGALLTGGLCGLSFSMIFLPPNLRLVVFVAPVSFLTAALVVADFRRRLLRSKDRVGPLLGVLLLILGLVCLVDLMLPALGGGGPKKSMRIVNNLMQIELMKQMWAADHGVTGSVRVTEQDLAPYAPHYSSNGLARQLTGERYIIHRLGVGPEAQLTKPYGKWPAGTVIRLRPESNRLFCVFLPNEPVGANGRQPVGLKTNRTSAAAGPGG
jgi:hypothetical protein